MDINELNGLLNIDKEIKYSNVNLDIKSDNSDFQSVKDVELNNELKKNDWNDSKYKDNLTNFVDTIELTNPVWNVIKKQNYKTNNSIDTNWINNETEKRQNIFKDSKIPDIYFEDLVDDFGNNETNFRKGIEYYKEMMELEHSVNTQSGVQRFLNESAGEFLNPANYLGIGETSIVKGLGKVFAGNLTYEETKTQTNFNYTQQEALLNTTLNTIMVGMFHGLGKGISKLKENNSNNNINIEETNNIDNVDNSNNNINIEETNNVNIYKKTKSINKKSDELGKLNDEIFITSKNIEKNKSKLKNLEDTLLNNKKTFKTNNKKNQVNKTKINEENNFNDKYVKDLKKDLIKLKEDGLNSNSNKILKIENEIKSIENKNIKNLDKIKKTNSNIKKQNKINIDNIKQNKKDIEDIKKNILDEQIYLNDKTLIQKELEKSNKKIVDDLNVKLDKNYEIKNKKNDKKINNEKSLKIKEEEIKLNNNENDIYNLNKKLNNDKEILSLESKKNELMDKLEQLKCKGK
jgi:hypothetical protein